MFFYHLKCLHVYTEQKSANFLVYKHDKKYIKKQQQQQQYNGLLLQNCTRQGTSKEEDNDNDNKSLCLLVVIHTFSFFHLYSLLYLRWEKCQPFYLQRASAFNLPLFFFFYFYHCPCVVLVCCFSTLVYFFFFLLSLYCPSANEWQHSQIVIFCLSCRRCFLCRRRRLSCRCCCWCCCCFHFLSKS